MKKQQILEKDIMDLKLDKSITETLKNNDINHIEDVWKKKRKDLKEIKLTDNEISQITIKFLVFFYKLLVNEKYNHFFL